jgi:hypothetical protein
MSDQINDLIARVKALEHAANGVLWPEGQPPAVKKPSAVALDHPPGATKMVSEYGRPTSTNLRSVWGWHGVDGVYDLGYRDGATQATCPHIVTSGEGTSYCALAEQTAAQPRQEVEPTPPPTPDGGLLEEVARLLANRISTMRPSADCTPLARTVLCVVADAAEKMARDPNLTWERVATWLHVNSEQ